MTETETNQIACIHARTKIRNGYEVCADCGLIFDQDFSNQDSRIFDQLQAKNRIIRSVVLSKCGYRTIFKSDKDIHGKSLTPKSVITFNRLQKIQRSSTTTIERDMAEYCTVIPRICSDLGLSIVIKEDVENLFISAINHGFARGRSLESTLAASILAMARMKSIPISIDEILRTMHLSPRTRKLMMSIYKDIKFALNKKVETQCISIEDYIKKYGNIINFPEPLITKSHEMFNFLTNKGLVSNGKDPSGIASAIIYIISKLNGVRMTQKRIADLTNVTEVTIRTRIKEMMCILAPIFLKKGIKF